MRITSETISQIQAERARRGLNQSQLAELLGLDRTTVSRILGGKIGTMRPEIVDAFNDKLGLDLQPLRILDGEVSPTAVALSRLADGNQHVADLLQSLMTLIRPENTPFLPDIPTAQLEKVGAAITRIVHTWEEGDEPHYAKIGAVTLDWLRDFYRKESARDARK